MHRSIKQHMVRNAKFTCFSKKKKEKTKKNHTQQQQQTPKNPKTKQNTKKTLGLTTKEIVLEFEQGVPPPQTRQHTLTFFCSLGSFIGEKKSIKKIQQNCFTMIKMN